MHRLRANSTEGATDNQSPRVSVVIPAFNARKTLLETLRSATAQTLDDIEVIVVDDGSTDDTRALAEQEAAKDARIQVISTQNGGVARARNIGIEAALAPFVATLDADDLWLPEKLKLQLDVIEADRDCTLVYTWYAVIDENSRVRRFHTPSYEGDAFNQFFVGNFIGHCSSPLMRREAVREAGGFNEGMYAAGAQGCEDLAIYMKLARAGGVRVVRRYLTGYRVGTYSMSSNWRGMLRSFDMAQAEFQALRPAGLDRTGQVNIFRFLLERALLAREWRTAWAIAVEATQRHALIGLAMLHPDILRVALPRAVRDAGKRILRRPLRWADMAYADLPSEAITHQPRAARQ